MKINGDIWKEQITLKSSYYHKLNTKKYKDFIVTNIGMQTI